MFNIITMNGNMCDTGKIHVMTITKIWNKDGLLSSRI